MSAKRWTEGQCRIERYYASVLGSVHVKRCDRGVSYDRVSSLLVEEVDVFASTRLQNSSKVAAATFTKETSKCVGATLWRPTFQTMHNGLIVQETLPVCRLERCLGQQPVMQGIFAGHAEACRLRGVSGKTSKNIHAGV